MNKLNQTQIQEIKQSSEAGKTTRELAIEFNVSHSTIAYHLNKTVILANQKKWWNKLSKERKKVYYDKRKEYLRNYMNNKYKTDEAFREKKKELQRNRYKNKFAEVVKGGKIKNNGRKIKWF